MDGGIPKYAFNPFPCVSLVGEIIGRCISDVDVTSGAISAKKITGFPK